MTSAQSEKVRQAALDDSLSVQRLAAADAQRAGAALEQTQNILKKRFADIEGLKLEEEVNLLMARSSATAAEQKEKAARLFLAYDRALDAKGAKKIEQLTALAAFPNIQGTAPEKKILDEIELAGGSMPRQSVAWASPINYADPRTVGTPGTVSGMKPGSPEAQAATGAPAAKPLRRSRDLSLADKMFETIMGTDAGKSVGRVLGKTRATVADNAAGARGRQARRAGAAGEHAVAGSRGQSYIVKNGQWVEIPSEHDRPEVLRVASFFPTRRTRRRPLLTRSHGWCFPRGPPASLSCRTRTRAPGRGSWEGPGTRSCERPPPISVMLMASWWASGLRPGIVGAAIGMLPTR